ncbi:hypothetical protein WA577_006418 [Blastocystis sp. JDR]
MAMSIASHFVPQLARMVLPSVASRAGSIVFQRGFASAQDKVIYIEDSDTYHNLKKGDKPCIMNFSATWCGPCKMMAPKFAALSATNDHVNFVKVDVDKSQDLALEERVMSVPTYKLYQSNKLLSQFAGADVSRLMEMIEEAK